MREYRKFYALDLSKWTETWGGSNWTKLLLDAYPCTYVSVTTSTAWTSSGVKFLYPHNITDIYNVEGVLEGELCFYGSAASAFSHVSDYRVSLIKVNSTGSETILATTGIKTITETLVARDYVNYHYWIDIYDTPKEISCLERLGLKIEWNISSGKTPALLSHDIGTGTCDDIWVDVPLIID